MKAKAFGFLIPTEQSCETFFILDLFNIYFLNFIFTPLGGEIASLFGRQWIPRSLKYTKQLFWLTTSLN